MQAKNWQWLSSARRSAAAIHACGLQPAFPPLFFNVSCTLDTARGMA
jgi:hypothetical protein